ncbi:histidine kinase dimerization/phosphoacceptor domain -containing protein [Marispirochaeta sp.]|jgi:two-component sensor histidine kinase|uniref:sensor histidine kinase n=1 Tax=Marispirochaeta sp. TaxID=2038653 RepID=UPI0029C6E62E|nr:histidine kinase dimerization/phosphoacceptor domain -containing protein [Marispirochaeta sp.]
MTHLAIDDYPDGILIVDTSNLRIQNSNSRAAELFMLDKQEICELSLKDLLPEAAERLFSGEENRSTKTRVHTIKGPSPKVLKITISASPDEKGTLRPLFLSEITNHYENRENLEKELQRRQLLEKEVHHRVKNSLAIVSSLISFKAGQSDNPQELAHLASQVDAVTAIHQQLAHEPGNLNVNIRSYLGNVVRSALTAYNHAHIEPRIMIDNLDISARTATSLGIIVNEIITNTCKYAFTPGPCTDAEIWLELTAERTDNQQDICLKIGNNGNFQQTQEQRKDSSGMGMMLIQALVQELEGRLSIIKEPYPAFELRLTLQD